MADWPPSLKPIGKYLARAKEVHHSHPLVAYYCRYYSLLRAIELRDTSDAAANAFVTSLLEKCELEKNAIGFDDGTHRDQVEEYALKQFYIADEQDRSGNATRQTATTFYAAMCFLQVCSVFGTPADDLEEKLRYAKWKAADIIKALREGRRPAPGAPGEAEPQPAPPPPDEHAHGDTPRSLPASDRSASPAPPKHVSPLLKPLYPRAQRLSPVPPAPPLREYDTQPGEVEPSAPPPMPPMPFEHELPPDAPPARRAHARELPAEAPPYPSSEEPSPAYPTASDAQEDGAEDADARVPNATPPPIPSLALPGDDAAPGAPRAHELYRRAQPAGRAAHNAPGEGNLDKKKVVVARAELSVPKRPVPETPASPVTTVPAAVRPARVAAYKPSIQQTQEAQRLCKYAASALDFEDMATAVSNLERALQLLKGSP